MTNADERDVLVFPKNLRLGDNELLVKNIFIHIPIRFVVSVSAGAQKYSYGFLSFGRVFPFASSR